MNYATLLLAALVLLPATGLAVWAFFAMALAEEELRAFAGFEGVAFEI